MERSFRDRLAAIEARNAELAGQPRNDITQDYGAGPQRSLHTSEPSDGFGALFAMPLGLILGAASVLAGQVIEFRFITEPAASMSTAAFGPAFMIALALSFIGDRILRGGAMGQTAITIGFVAMMWFEIELAKLFPAFWGQLYGDPAMILSWIARAG